MLKPIHIAKYIKLCFWFLIFISFSRALHLKAQSPYYYHLNEESGLPSSEVYQVLQDKFGYIWIGCDAGLCRYDGSRFKIYSNSQQNSKSISGLRLDNLGNVWCQNFSGQIFKVSGDSLKLFSGILNNASSYQQYTIDNKNRIWIANNKRIELYDYNGEKIKSLYKINQQHDTVIWHEVEVDKSGVILATGLNYGLVKASVTTDNNVKVKLIDSSSVFKNRTSFELTNNGLISLSEENPIRKYIIAEIINGKVELKNSMLPFSPNGIIYKIYKDNLDRNWACTSNGVSLLNKNFNSFSNDQFFLKEDKISGLYQDREGNLWISSLQNGLYVVPNYDLKIYTQQNSLLADHNITSLFISSKNELYVGTFSGLVYKIAKQAGLSPIVLSEQLSYRTVKKITENNGQLFVAHGPLSVINANKTKSYKVFNARDFCWLGDTLFLALPTGFACIPDFKLVDKIQYGNEQKIFHSKSTKVVVTDSVNKKVYFASIDGLFQYQDGKVTEVKIDGQTVFVNKLSIYKNDLWVGTVNDGLYLISNNNFKFKYSQQNGLRGNTIRCFRVYKDKIWVATDLGLNVIDVKTQTIKYLSYTDGIATREINDIIEWNGKVYLATNKGLYEFENRDNEKQTVSPNIELTNVFVNGNQYKLDNNIKLSYAQNNLLFKFNTACFKARGNYFYKYRLLGLDSVWRINQALENEVSYSALPSGSFTFQVLAVNEKGISSIEPINYVFVIAKPTWQQWWFYLVAFIVALAIVVLVATFVIKNIQKKARVKNELVSSQLTAIRAQMNPHFMYNTLNSIQDLILKNEIKNTNYYLSKFSSLMRKILEFSGIEQIVLDDEVEMLTSYLELEKLRFGDDFKFSIEVSNDVDIYKTHIPSLIIQPFVENSIKHGLLHKRGKKELVIKFIRDDKYIVVIVDDNGVGRKRSDEIKQKSQIQHKSFATEATQKRIDLLNNNYSEKIEIEIIDKEDLNVVLGTKVIIKFPIENCNS